jgi:PfaD family protein
LLPDWLGDPSFQRMYGVRLNYVAGAMANGIASETLVCAMARAGMMGFFGAAGLSTARITAAIDTIQRSIGDLPWGSNLIHSPADPRQEQETVELYLARGVQVVSSSAYMSLTPMVVQYRCTGLAENADGTVAIRNRLLAKVSRTEVAERFLRPPPESMLRALVVAGKLTADEARLGARISMADDLTAEADSGGHTDNRPLSVLMPLLIGLRDRVAKDFAPASAVRVGAAGGLGDPSSVAAAFGLGAAYVVTGTVNQACIEAGTSKMVRGLLATAGMADVGMAPASDMFEGGVEVQVLKRGTLFAMRGKQLYELYRAHEGLHTLPEDVRQRLETKIFRQPLDDVWASTAAFFTERDPDQVRRAEADPKHKMALVFRWYLGLSSRWAIAGDTSRRSDCQVWCGPAIGAFNAWTTDTFLADPDSRKVAIVGANLMAGAAALTRARWLQQQGIDPGPEAFHWSPRPLRERPRPKALQEPHVHA